MFPTERWTFATSTRPPRKMHIPCQTCENLFDRMHGSNIFSTLDVVHANRSVPLKEADKELTAFVSTRGQFEFNRIPLGLCNDQASYQRPVDQALRLRHGVQAFVNHSCVHSPDFKSHLAHLEGVYLRFAQAGIQLRASKCRFGYPEVEFLGHFISPKERGRSPSGIGHRIARPVTSA